jgi:hypothetical protein
VSHCNGSSDIVINYTQNLFGTYRPSNYPDQIYIFTEDLLRDEPLSKFILIVLGMLFPPYNAKDPHVSTVNDKRVKYENKVISNDMIIIPNFTKIGQLVDLSTTLMSVTKSGDRKSDRHRTFRARNSCSLIIWNSKKYNLLSQVRNKLCYNMETNMAFCILYLISDCAVCVF